MRNRDDKLDEVADFVFDDEEAALAPLDRAERYLGKIITATTSLEIELKAMIRAICAEPEVKDVTKTINPALYTLEETIDLFDDVSRKYISQSRIDLDDTLSDLVQRLRSVAIKQSIYAQADPRWYSYPQALIVKTRSEETGESRLVRRFNQAVMREDLHLVVAAHERLISFWNDLAGQGEQTAEETEAEKAERYEAEGFAIGELWAVKCATAHQLQTLYANCPDDWPAGYEGYVCVRDIPILTRWEFGEKVKTYDEVDEYVSNFWKQIYYKFKDSAIRRSNKPWLIGFVRGAIRVCESEHETQPHGGDQS